MSVLPPRDSGQWITPPPASDGSDIWSSVEYSSSTDTDHELARMLAALDELGSGVGGRQQRAHASSLGLRAASTSRWAV